MRILTISDLHVDYAENLSWLLHFVNSPEDDFSDDVLIVAGDICDDLPLLQEVLTCLESAFRCVFFVPGNHELWVSRGGDSIEIDCSLEKFHAVLQLCADLGVHTQPCEFAGISIVPLYSWYDFSFGEPDEYLLRAWRDFRACRWPDHLARAELISEYFLKLNEPRLNISNQLVISFSHFLPSLDVMPASIPEKRRKVYPVLGSINLGAQIKLLNPDIHIYGHSHVNQEKHIGGINYVNNAFAYPKEEGISRKAIHCVYDSRVDPVAGQLV